MSLLGLRAESEFPCFKYGGLTLAYYFLQTAYFIFLSQERATLFKERLIKDNFTGVILGGYEEYAYPQLFGVGVPYPHFSRAVTRQITKQTQAFSTEQDTNCQIGANSARRLQYTRLTRSRFKFAGLLQTEYYKMVDTASSKLHDIVNKEGTAAYEALESCLLSGSVSESCLPCRTRRRPTAHPARNVSSAV